MKLIVSEYHIIHEALKCYEERSDKLSSMTTDEDQEVIYDEKLQDIEGMIKALKIAAKNDFDLEL
ncbi:hypothetical protein [Pseudoalteromonas ruthenica]|uniref:Uncharacterized protein n=1 Tax=Pseudoalteromonas ruthenica TaxID=151081 RepID=A0A0F4PZH8_9GAMM|nr:hypothetical protein [Pseudoalteromonas ruthenica]KJY95673.1 hypothetical protein TW76_13890 [Pseudoalteromonas ruthenica]KJZ00439.1 hypothetical protein TW72_07055 [Pseudoalteromonas ruthenica]TMO87256.1 hypothetical protein CWC12_11060 [Pseudoalteromonas ruthenica]TMO94383.1 hypothetical protein CWC13_03165 [Pseudoalteromonas ruthenica]TMP01148.1 hypothetical protein CWC07_02190 [Pseudoalteromonas ruthenica]